MRSSVMRMPSRLTVGRSLAARPVEPGMIVLSDDAPEDLVDRLGQVPSPYFLLVGPEGHPAGVLLRADINRLLGTPAVGLAGR